MAKLSDLRSMLDNARARVRVETPKPAQRINGSSKRALGAKSMFDLARAVVGNEENIVGRQLQVFSFALENLFHIDRNLLAGCGLGQRLAQYQPGI